MYCGLSEAFKMLVDRAYSEVDLELLSIDSLLQSKICDW